MAGMGTDYDMINGKIVTSPSSDDYLISIFNEDEEGEEGEEGEEMNNKEGQTDQQKTSGRAISHPSSTKSVEDDWFRSMSGLPAETSQESKISVLSPAEIQESGIVTDAKWCKKIIQVGKKNAESGPQSKKFGKVPHILRRNETRKQSLFTPSFVCIGPYHYSNKRLRQWDLKAKLAYCFVKNSKPAAAAGAADLEDVTESFDKLFKKFQELGVNSKQYYYSSDSSTARTARPAVPNEKEFVRMMFLDACFVLQFILWSARDYPSLMSVMNDHIADSVSRDLLLLENQIPFHVLTSLGGIERGAWQETLHRYFSMEVCKFLTPKYSICQLIGALLRKFVCCARNDVSIAGQAPPSTCEVNPRHLLAFFHSQFINNQTIGGAESNRYAKYSAKELKKAGVHFRTSKSPFFTDVKYRETFLAGELTLPQITIDESTKSMLLNLVAYEYCHEPAQKCWVTSYACFMDSLINDAEDVKVLRSKGILFNFRETDEVVADLFNEMGTYLIPNLSAYVDAKRGIDEHCKSSVKKWVAEFWRIYFRSPWSIIAVVAAALAIFLTAVQTYIAAFGKNN